jgi:lipid II isoglutaminyl synthase (glutamine-hydrolysing)
MMAGVDNIWKEPELASVLTKIKDLPTDHVYVLASYTAVLQLRKLLAEKGYIKGGMD